MRVLLVLLLLLSEYTQQSEGFGVISGWKDTWSPSAITLDEFIEGERTLTLNIRPSTSITDGIIELVCPSVSGISCPSLTQTITLESEKDSAVSFTVSFESPGTYGPFGVFTRGSSSGPRLDINMAFGSVVILNRSKLTSLAVDPTIQGSIRSSTPVDIYFSFTLDLSLWKDDLIVITLPTNHETSQILTCQSETNSNGQNLVFAGNSHSLPCEVNSNGKIVVYGISQGVTVETEYEVKLKIGKFYIPTYSSNEWTLKILRFSTNYIVQEYYSRDVPYSVSPGNITEISWSSYRGWSAYDIPLEQQVYMIVSFFTEHYIPERGYFYISFSGVDITEGVSASYISSQNDISASGSGCTISYEESVGKSFSVVLLMEFTSATPSIDSISTYTTDGQLIDDITNPLSLSVGTRSQKLNGFAILTSAVNGSSSANITFSISSSVQSPEIEIDCPFFESSDTPLTDKIGINSSTKWFLEDSEVSNQATEILFRGVMETDSNTPTIEVHAEGISLPIIPQSTTTFYECYASATASTGSNVGIALMAFAIDTSPNLEFKAMVYDSGLNIKAPMLIEYVPENFPLDSDVNYQLTVINSNYLGIFEEISIESPVSLSKGNAEISESDTSTFTISGFTETIELTETLKIWVPGLKSTSNVSLSIILNLMIRDESYGVSHLVGSKTITLNQYTIDGQFTFSLQNTETIYPSSTMHLVFSTTNTSGLDSLDFLVLMFPVGFDIENALISGLETVVLDSQDDKRAVVGRAPSSNYFTSSIDVTVTGIRSPSYAMNGVVSVILSKDEEGTISKYENTQVTITTTKGFMQDPTFSITSSQEAKGNFISTEMEIGMFITHPIPVNGEIIIGFTNQFSITPYTECSLNGIAGTCNTGTFSFSIEEELVGEAQLIVTGLFGAILTSCDQGESLVAKVGTYYSGNAIEESSDNIGQCLTGSINTEPVLFEVNTASIVPSFNHVSDVDLKMTCPENIPKGSVFRLSFAEVILNISLSEIADFLVVSFSTMETSMSGTDIYVTANEMIEAGDSAEFTLLSIFKFSTLTTVVIEVSWQSTLICEYSGLQIFNTAGSIESPSLSLSAENIGELSDYTFTFQSNAQVNAGTQLILKFPENLYSPSLGIVRPIFKDNEEVDEILCESEDPGIQCIVKNWRVNISFTSAVNYPISITVHDIYNPSQTESGDFRIVILAGESIFASDAFGFQPLKDFPPLLDVKYVENIGKTLLERSGYAFSFYYSSSLSSNHTIHVDFPDMYMLDSASTLLCSLVAYEDIPSSSIEIWKETDRSCIKTGNRLEFTLGSEISTNNTLRYELTVHNAMNPEWALSRTFEEYFYDLKLEDSNSLWTTKFKIRILDTGANEVLAKSIENFNSGYVRIQPSEGRLNVNQYDVVSNTNFLTAYPGFYSDSFSISASSESVHAEFELIPRITELYSDEVVESLYFVSDFHNLRFDRWTQSVTSRIVAETTLSPGYYKVTYEFEKLDSNSLDLDKPTSTLIKVLPSITGNILLMNSSPRLYNQEENVFNFTLDYAPSFDLDFSLTFDVGMDSVSSMTFKKGVFSQFLQVKGDNIPKVVSISPTGEGASIYNNIDVEFTAHEINDDPVNFSVRFEIENKSVIVHLQSTKGGIVYWNLGCSGSYFRTWEKKVSIDDLNNNSNVLQDQLSQEYFESFPYDTFLDYQIEKYRRHCNRVYESYLVIEEEIDYSIDLYWLADSTDYNFEATLSQQSISENTVSTNFYTSFSTNKSDLYTIKIIFLEIVSESEKFYIQERIAENYDIYKDWLYFTRYSAYVSSMFEWIVLHDRFSAVKSYDLTRKSDSELLSALETIYGKVKIEIAKAEDTAYYYTVPGYVELPKVFEEAEDYIDFSLTTDSDGIVYCTCFEDEINVSVEKSIAGLNNNNQFSDSFDYEEIEASSEHKIRCKNLDSNKKYYCFINICNLLPFTEQCAEQQMVTGSTFSIYYYREYLGLFIVFFLSSVCFYLYYLTSNQKEDEEELHLMSPDI